MSKRQSKKSVARQRRKREERRKETRRGLAEQLLHVEDLLEDDKLEQARDQLEDLARRHPGHPEVLALLANTCQELDDPHATLDACQRLARLTPQEPEVHLMLAGAALECECPATARRAFLKFLALGPSDPRADDVRDTVSGIEELVRGYFSDLNLSEQELWEAAQLHEEILALLGCGQLRRLCETADQLLKRLPDFVPALNNKAQALRLLGDIAGAAELSRQVLDLEPDNCHALANLVCCQVLTGEQKEARATGQRLLAVRSEDADLYVRQAEALSFLGDDAGVLAALQGAEQKERPLEGRSDALLLHFAAAAAARRGEASQARALWKRALEISPDFTPAVENLDDFDERPEERMGPWSLSLPQLVPEELIDDLLQRFAARGKSDAQRDLCRRFVQQHPHLLALLPIVLDRGDHTSRQLFENLAIQSRCEPMLDALKDFALGQRGSYRARIDLAMALAQAGVLPSGMVRLWDGHEWRETMLAGYEIYTEPIKSSLKPAASELAHQGYWAQQEEDYPRAAELLRQALRLEPQSPMILNNLSTALLAMGRTSEAEEIQDYVFERFPDYLFGRINRVHRLIDAKRWSEAEEILKPLLSRSRLHISEFGALASAQVNLLLAQGKREAALSWLDMWERVDPDHPQLEIFRRRARPSRFGPLGKALFGDE